MCLSLFGNYKWFVHVPPAIYYASEVALYCCSDVRVGEVFFSALGGFKI